MMDFRMVIMVILFQRFTLFALKAEHSINLQSDQLHDVNKRLTVLIRITS